MGRKLNQGCNYHLSLSNYFLLWSVRSLKNNLKLLMTSCHSTRWHLQKTFVSLTTQVYSIYTAIKLGKNRKSLYYSFNQHTILVHLSKSSSSFFSQSIKELEHFTTVCFWLDKYYVTYSFSRISSIWEYPITISPCFPTIKDVIDMLLMC